MLAENTQRITYTEEEIKRHCARIVIDGFSVEDDESSVPPVTDCLLADNGLRIIETYLAKGYPRFNFRKCALPKDCADFLDAFSISERSRIKLYGNIFGFSIFFGNRLVSTRLLDSMDESINKTHFVMIEDGPQMLDDSVVGIMNSDNVAEYVLNENERWTLLEVALAAPSGDVLALLEDRMRSDSHASVLRQQLRVEKNSAKSPLSKMVRHFVEVGNLEKIATVDRLLKQTGSSVTFGEHFRDVIFEAIRKRSLPPSVLARIPGLTKNMTDRNQNSWVLYLDAFISEKDRPAYEDLFLRTAAGTQSNGA